MKIKVNPLFFAFVLALVAFGHGVDIAFCLLALVFHEGAHAIVAKSRGYVLKNIVLLPYGAVMSTHESFDKISSVLIGIAGPLSNLALALVTLGVWWLFPDAYAITQPFLYANLSLGLFNLIPVFPLDGSRIVLGFCKNKLKAIKILRVLGVVCSILLFSMFLASFFFEFNLSLGIMAVFLFYGASFVAKEQAYASVVDCTKKNYALGVEKRCVCISSHTPLVRLFHQTSSQSLTTFEIVDDNGSIIATLLESDIKDIAIKNKLTKEIGDFVR